MTDFTPVNLQRDLVSGKIPLSVRLKLFKGLASSKLPNAQKMALVKWLQSEATVTSATLPAYGTVPIYTVLININNIVSPTIW